jgi:hypothetical protein
MKPHFVWWYYKGVLHFQFIRNGTNIGSNPSSIESLDKDLDALLLSLGFDVSEITIECIGVTE